VLSKAHTRQQGLRRERSSTSLANALAHSIDLLSTSLGPSDEEVDGGGLSRGRSKSGWGWG